MKDNVIRELERLEQQHSIKVLYAVESGSRAWGFASKDSDWDIRFIYVHQPDWYLRIETGRDNMDEITPQDIDLAGWELRKALKLFRKSNPPMLEWLGSPIVYLESYPTAARLRELMKVYFNPRSCIHHYFHMAERNFREYLLKEVVRTKKFLYVFRPILACRWILSHGTMPPTAFNEIIESELTDTAVRSELDKLLARKMAGEELDEEPRNKILFEYLASEIEYFTEKSREIEEAGTPETDLLNELFRQSLSEAWPAK